MKWGREVLFPANPDLADILGDVDFELENFYFRDLGGFQISKSRFPDFQNLARAGLGPWAGWALRWPRVGPRVDASLIRSHLFLIRITLML